VVFGLIDQ